MGTIWSKLIWALADEFAVWEYNFSRLMIEIIPGLSTWLLDGWERVLGIIPSGTEAERQQVAHGKYTAQYSGLSVSVYLGIAAQYGSTITIIEAPSGNPFRVDHNRVDRTPDAGINGARLNSVRATHYWEVKISATDPNRNALRTLFETLIPAHTIMVWTEI